MCLYQGQTNKLKVKYIAVGFSTVQMYEKEKNFENLFLGKKWASVRVNVRMSKIMRTPIKVGVRRYVRDVRQLSNPDISFDEI